MGAHHEIRIQTYKDLGVIHRAPARVIDCFHHAAIQGVRIHAFITDDATRGSGTAGDGAIIEQ